MANIRMSRDTAVTVTGNITLNDGHNTLLLDASAGNIIVTLPLAATSTNKYLFEMVDVSNTISFAATGGDTIPVPVIIIDKSYAIQSDGVSERIIVDSEMVFGTVAGTAAEGNDARLADETLAATLTAGNATGGTDIVVTASDVIKASSGGCELNLTVGGADDIFDLTTDTGGYAEAWIYGTTALTQMGFNYGVGATLTMINTGWDINSAQSGDKTGFFMNNAQVFFTDDMTVGGVPIAGKTIQVQDVITTLATSGGVANQAVFIGVDAGSTIAVGLDNTVVASGTGIAAKTSNSLYANQVSLQQSGVLFDTIVAPSTATADRTVTLPDASGTVALAPEKFYLTRTETIDETTATPKEYFTFVQGGTEIVNVVSAIGGLYDYELSFICHNTSITGSIQVEPQLNAVDIFDVPMIVDPANATNQYYVNIKKQITLSVGNNTLAVNMSNNLNGTARMYEANLYLTQVV